ncbi:DUF6932 family protein [Rhodopila sp.]|uniref:DUF6932 family protein n=1 Tax=Rhodopila sp. TaxID=2480087 RepID=UPI003D10CAC7
MELLLTAVRSRTSYFFKNAQEPWTFDGHNDIVVLMIPGLIDLGSPSPWPVLPPGIYEASLSEIEMAFATTPHRRWLFAGFLRMAAALKTAGCRTAYLDGSFTTGKPHPDYYDGCWDHNSIDFARLDPVLLNFTRKREEQKRKYQGEMFPALTLNGTSGTFLDFFQIEKFSGLPKGILRVSLAVLNGATP